MSRKRILSLVLVLAATAAGCVNSIIRELGPGNDETIVILPDSLTYLASNLENVSDRVAFEWTNREPRLQLNHQSFLPHGYGLLIVRDAVGTVVDSTLLEYQLVTESRAGVPGVWTATLIYAAAWGRAQFSLVPLPADAVPSAAGTAAPPAVADYRRAQR